jgi:hypothetical protein
MTTNIWRGDAQPIPQVWYLKPTTVEIGDIYVIICNGKEFTYKVLAEFLWSEPRP